MNLSTTSKDGSTERIPRGRLGEIAPPRDVLRDVFPPSVRQNWRERPTNEILRRLDVLSACGPFPEDIRRACKLRYLRAHKAAWETYLFTAFACGMFENEQGKNLRKRLADHNEDNFRGAMAECMTCWFFAGRHKISLSPFAAGRNGRNLDMQIFLADQPVGVEVKAPFRKSPSERVWWGDDSDKIAQSMVEANKQLTGDRPNLLVLVPSLRRLLYSCRYDLLRAVIGQTKITWDFNPQTSEAGETEVKFFPDGRFLNTSKPKGGMLKPDGFPAYRRISAIISIEEKIVERYPFPDPFLLIDGERSVQNRPEWKHARDLHFHPDNRCWVDHDVLVLHNPYAYHAISKDHLAQYPQLILEHGDLIWTDGEDVVV